jgi:chemotaxis family two-component system response regulator Rcp1
VKSSDQPIDILFAEDNPADTVLFREYLKSSDLPYRLYAVHDGEAALAFLQQEGFYADMPRPHLILLNIGLPKRDGWDVLTVIRATPALTRIPVVMLRGVISPEDDKHRAALQPLACFEKPMNSRGYRSLVETLEKLVRQKSPEPS